MCPHRPSQQQCVNLKRRSARCARHHLHRHVAAGTSRVIAPCAVRVAPVTTSNDDERFATHTTSLTNDRRQLSPPRCAVRVAHVTTASDNGRKDMKTASVPNNSTPPTLTRQTSVTDEVITTNVDTIHAVVEALALAISGLGPCHLWLANFSALCLVNSASACP